MDEIKQYECLELDELWKVMKSVLVNEVKKVCEVNRRTNVNEKDNEWKNFEMRKVVIEKKKVRLDLLSAKDNYRVQRKDTLKDNLKYAKNARNRTTSKLDPAKVNSGFSASRITWRDSKAVSERLELNCKLRRADDVCFPLRSAGRIKLKKLQNRPRMRLHGSRGFNWDTLDYLRRKRLQ
ncbi:hypothetical protein EVAR_38503_1 [Eumeta japonica]|uniref:Uncharacterized protein n=1 Tax=Eumeta variegata TaxID=151549 RepID=A0A4C1WBU4_EUMVA|nr:hypothetical protein EVAR_38503_1 [Eumeta japonica]